MPNFEIQVYYKNEPKLKGIWLQLIGWLIFELILDEQRLRTTYWIALYANDDNMTYFDNFRVDHIWKAGNKNIITNISRMQTFDSMMCGYFCCKLIERFYVQEEY